MTARTDCKELSGSGLPIGRKLKWDWVLKAWMLDVSLPKYEFGDLPMRPVAMPGKTPLV
jgi:hypothetical protein